PTTWARPRSRCRPRSWTGWRRRAASSPSTPAPSSTSSRAGSGTAEAGYSGQPATGVQLHVSVGVTSVAGPLGVTVAKPRAKIALQSASEPQAAPVPPLQWPPVHGGEGQPSTSDHTVASSRTLKRKWTPLGSGAPLPMVRTTLPFWSAPAPPAVVLHGLAAGSSAVPYMQSSPGSLVSPILVTSLSPVCGFEVFTTPIPHAFWSTRTQKFSPGRRKVGTLKPGWSQHVVVVHSGFGSAQLGVT